MIDALVEALALKDVDRTGWRRRGLTGVESVAAHSWGMALLVLVLCPDDLDRERCLTYAVLHDLAEAWTGDHPPADGVLDKPEREDAAMADLCARLGRPELLAIWRAYEAQADAEAAFVKQLDRLDMGLQAQRYRERGLDPTEFLASASARLTPPYDALMTEGAPLACSSVKFVGDPVLVAMAAALAVHRYGSRMEVAADAPSNSPRIDEVLAEDGVPPFVRRPTRPPEVTVAVGPDVSGFDVDWSMRPPADSLTSHRIRRDSLRRRLDGLIPSPS